LPSAWYTRERTLGNPSGVGEAVTMSDPARAFILATRSRTVYNTNHQAINSANAMNAISANDLKTKGVGAIEEALEGNLEASVTVRGQAKYVVMSREHYSHLRECELEAALAESRADLDAGRFVKESVERHIKRLAKLAA
jgi:tRNA U34 5-carboxymethylaminomethyl modifying GTPase MnmE/TrmE